MRLKGGKLFENFLIAVVREVLYNKTMDNKNMPAFVFVAVLFPAAIFDLFSIVPFLGNLTSALFIFFARLSFWITGYRSKGTAGLTAGTALLELIPGFSVLPGCLAFVTGFYLMNKTSGIVSKITTKNSGGGKEKGTVVA